MIKSIEHVKAVQKRRMALGLHGHARAVRRFVQKSTGDYYGVLAMKSELPSNAIRKENSDDAVKV